MPKRSYTQTRRARLREETRERIIRATVDLHAEHGPLETTYGMIADRAEVALQTVYNHFPGRDDLLRGCTSHVNARAPRLDASCFDALTAPADRLAALAQTVYAHHRYMAPWMRHGWREAGELPVLAEVIARGERELRALLRQAAESGGEIPAGFLDAAMALLDFPAWQRLTRTRTSTQAGRLAGQALAALLHLSHAETGAPHDHDDNA